ncbi:hypothetical protein MOQ_006371 [Trypanosoma cruzi marinkellei]|uniref:WW domain-containing protein n=1 Tax=Trypanosoma cruzi marinkellei TaxID=85056 RepID=K2NLQ3_TRYCR|nr:hypothetical protein MOQ_006371 [Trypanosoma cruzi marinkellei]
MDGDAQASVSRGDDCEMTLGTGLNSPGNVACWSTCAVLTERLRLLQLRGKALDTRLVELRRECETVGRGEPENTWESKGLSTSTQEDDVKSWGVAHIGERPYSSYPPYSFVRVKTDTSFSYVNSSSPQQVTRFQEANCSLLNATPAGHSKARDTGHSPSPPLIIVEVMDTGDATPRPAPRGIVASVASVAEETEPLTQSLLDETTATHQLKSDGNLHTERQEQIFFLMDQIQQINVPARLASPAANLFKRVHEGLCNQGNPAAESVALNSNDTQTVESKGAGEISAAMDGGQDQPPPLPNAESSVDNGDVAVIPAEVRTKSGTANVSQKNNSSSISSSVPMPQVLPDLSSSESKPVVSIGVKNSHREISQSAVDYEEEARVMLQRGEWKEARDKKGRIYYYHPKEKRSCWNLAKQLKLLAKANRETDKDALER